MGDDGLDSVTLTAKQFRIIVTGIVSGVVFVGGIAGSGVLRIDKFGLSDFKQHIASVKREMRLDLRELQTECQTKINDLEFRINRSFTNFTDGVPPHPVRQRIQANEECRRDVCPDIKQPTYEWR